VSAAGGFVSGVAFHDANGDGAGPQDGEYGLAGWVVFADVNRNGARDAREPSATAAADGRYRLGPLAPAAYSLRVVSPAGGGCPAGATCVKEVMVGDGAEVTQDFAIVSAGDPGRQVLDENPVRVGSVRLSLPRRCAIGSFRAVLRGVAVSRVDFALDGRRVRSVRRPDAAGRWSAVVRTRGLRAGWHEVAAGVWFSPLASKPDTTVRGRFRRCALPFAG
jgi:hypothetical protein